MLHTDNGTYCGACDLLKGRPYCKLHSRLNIPTNASYHIHIHTTNNMQIYNNACSPLAYALNASILEMTSQTTEYGAYAILRMLLKQTDTLLVTILIRQSWMTAYSHWEVTYRDKRRHKGPWLASKHRWEGGGAASLQSFNKASAYSCPKSCANPR